MQRILRALILVGKEIRGVEHGIPQILECRPVKLVRPALGNDIHLAAGTAAKLCRGHTGLHHKFLNGIGDTEVAERRVDLRVDIADSIQKKYVGLGAGAGHIESATLCTGGRWQNTRCHKGQVQVLACVRSEERRVGKECRSRWSLYL